MGVRWSPWRRRLVARVPVASPLMAWPLFLSRPLLLSRTLISPSSLVISTDWLLSRSFPLSSLIFPVWWLMVVPDLLLFPFPQILSIDVLESVLLVYLLASFRLLSLWFFPLSEFFHSNIHTFSVLFWNTLSLFHLLTIGVNFAYFVDEIILIFLNLLYFERFWYHVDCFFLQPVYSRILVLIANLSPQSNIVLESLRIFGVGRLEILSIFMRWLIDSFVVFFELRCRLSFLQLLLLLFFIFLISWFRQVFSNHWRVWSLLSHGHFWLKFWFLIKLLREVLAIFEFIFLSVMDFFFLLRKDDVFDDAFRVFVVSSLQQYF